MAKKRSDFPPVVSLVNRCDDLQDDEIEKIASALTTQVKEDFDPAWGCPATIRAINSPGASDWQIVFLNDAEAADNLGYHELTLNGQPISKVFVRATLKAGQKVSTTASHELLEMLIDPGAQMWAQHSDGAMYAYEVCDAVEEVEYQIGGIWVSDFVYPSFFEYWHAPNSTKFDREGKVSRPFQTLRRGYQVISSSGRIGEVFASEFKERHFLEVEDRMFHRSEYRIARSQASSPPFREPSLADATRADALRYAGRHLMALADAGDPFGREWNFPRGDSTPVGSRSTARGGDPFGGGWNFPRGDSRSVGGRSSAGGGDPFGGGWNFPRGDSRSLGGRSSAGGGDPFGGEFNFPGGEESSAPPVPFGLRIVWR
jgi:hypothetical protein